MYVRVCTCIYRRVCAGSALPRALCLCGMSSTQLLKEKWRKLPALSRDFPNAPKAEGRQQIQSVFVPGSGVGSSLQPPDTELLPEAGLGTDAVSVSPHCTFCTSGEKAEWVCARGIFSSGFGTKNSKTEDPFKKCVSSQSRGTMPLAWVVFICNVPSCGVCRGVLKVMVKAVCSCCFSEIRLCWPFFLKWQQFGLYVFISVNFRCTLLL